MRKNLWRCYFSIDTGGDRQDNFYLFLIFCWIRFCSWLYFCFFFHLPRFLYIFFPSSTLMSSG